MVGPDHGAVDHLELVGFELRMVQGSLDVLPEPGERPAPKLATDRRPFAELFGRISSGLPSPRDPKNAKNNKPMVRRVRPSGCKTARLKPLKNAQSTSSTRLRVKVHSNEEMILHRSRQRRGMPFCQHNLAQLGQHRDTKGLNELTLVSANTV